MVTYEGTYYRDNRVYKTMKYLIIISLLGLTSCAASRPQQSTLIYSDYESAGGFNYMEDVKDGL